MRSILIVPVLLLLTTTPAHAGLMGDTFTKGPGLAMFQLFVLSVVVGVLCFAVKVGNKGDWIVWIQLMGLTTGLGIVLTHLYNLVTLILKFKDI